MKILVDMGHPTDVNLFKNVIWELERRGHIVKITARDKENTAAILDAYRFKYEPVKHYKGLMNKAIGVLKNDIWLYRISKQFKPDIFVSAGSPYAAQVSKIIGRPHIAFPDTERANLAIRLMLPFTDMVCTPSFFKRNLGSKQVIFDSFFELAYLHPNYFKPDPAILDEIGIKSDEKFILMRFSSLDSHHDIGVRGFDFKSDKEMYGFIKKVETLGRICLTSEIKLNSELEKYRVVVPIKEFHSFVSFATLYIGEGAKTASEAAILGIPSIYVSTSRRGYLDELQHRYGLAYTYSNREEAIQMAVKILEYENVKTEWQRKRKKLLDENIDVVKFMVESIEKYGNTKGG
jgi:predicted glycosyltransferase